MTDTKGGDGDPRGQPIPEHPDDVLFASECLRPWAKCVARDGWGPLGRECVERILAHTPEDRVLGAHALLERGHVATLFDLCMQKIVPMGVARALLHQRFAFIPHRRLRLYVWHDGKPKARSTRCAQAKRRIDPRAQQQQQQHGQQVLFRWPRWWVAACGCPTRVTGSGCGLGGDCPRTRLMEISERDGLRMMARHWAVQIQACYQSAFYGICDAEAYCRGWDERDLKRVARDDGHAALAQANLRDPTTSASLIPKWRAGYHEMTRATHPWESRILVAHVGSTYSDFTRMPCGQVCASVIGDPLFGVHIAF